MIKLIAALMMMIDHIGVILFPTSYVLYAIGRLSMPLFAYCIARGFYYSKQHGTLKKYLFNMSLLAIISQVPYSYMVPGKLNTCFTWLISLLLLLISTNKYKTRFCCIMSILGIYGITFILVEFKIFPVDYGLYGVITPLLFYLLIKSNRENIATYTLVLAVSSMFYISVQHGTSSQIISIFSAFILTVIKKFDKKIKFPKWVFYFFYPVHIVVLLFIRNYLQV